MSFSLNEIEALSKRAARGAGLSWGMSEESARAIRWLASHDLPGADLLVDVLERNQGIAAATLAPMSIEGHWQGAAGRLCPLAAGAALNDCADRLAGEAAVVLNGVTHPLLVVPLPPGRRSISACRFRCAGKRRGFARMDLACRLVGQARMLKHRRR